MDEFVAYLGCAVIAAVVGGLAAGLTVLVRAFLRERRLKRIVRHWPVERL